MSYSNVWTGSTRAQPGPSYQQASKSTRHSTFEERHGGTWWSTLRLIVPKRVTMTHVSNTRTSPMTPLTLKFSEVFPGSSSDEIFFSKPDWCDPVCFFVGRNGSGKSRAAKLVAERLNGRWLSTDRLAGLTNYRHLSWTSIPQSEGYRGIPLGDSERDQARSLAKSNGAGIDEIYALKEEPELWLRVAAFLRRSLGRVIELRENSGFLDPYVQFGSTEYSLLRDEGHGLRELVILLAAIYRDDWELLVVDEPELHLHPSMARLCIGELERICSGSDRRALVVTHEPTLIKPTKAEDLKAIHYFATGSAAITMWDAVREDAVSKVTASLQHNPQLVSTLVFSPRPVLVEGIHDVTALTVSLARTQAPEVVAQTDLIECGGNGQVATWFEIAHALGVDVRAVADLDCLLAREVQRVMDRSAVVTACYRDDLAAHPTTTSEVLRPLIPAMNGDNVEKSPKERAKWLANPPQGTGHEARVQKLIAIWKDAGFWLHDRGTLEDVLGISEKSKEAAKMAAGQPGPIDKVAAWCAYKLDTLGELGILLGIAVERIAHAIMESLRATPGSEFSAPVGGPDGANARLVRVAHVGNGVHRLTVLEPEEFAGYWLEFSRATPSTELLLREPGSEEGSAARIGDI